MSPNPPPLGQAHINIVQTNNSGCRTLLFVCLGIVLAITLVIGGCVVLGVWTIGETVDQVVESVKETEAEAKASPITAITWNAVTNARTPDNTLTELQQEACQLELALVQSEFRELVMVEECKIQEDCIMTFILQQFLQTSTVSKRFNPMKKTFQSVH